MATALVLPETDLIQKFMEGLCGFINFLDFLEKNFLKRKAFAKIVSTIISLKEDI